MKLLAAALLFAALPCAAQTVQVPREGAVIAELTGTVESPQGSNWAKMVRGEALRPGALVRVGRKSSAVLVFPDASKVSLSADTVFTLESSTRKDISLFVKLGTVQAWVTKVRGRRFKIRSSAAVAAVRGTILKYTVLTDGRAQIDLFTGKLDVSDAFGRPTKMDAGERLTTNDEGSKTEDLPPTTKTPTEPKVDFTLAEGSKDGGGEGKETADVAGEEETSEAEKTDDFKDDTAKIEETPVNNPKQDLKIDDKPVSPSSPEAP